MSFNKEDLAKFLLDNKPIFDTIKSSHIEHELISICSEEFKEELLRLIRVEIGNSIQNYSFIVETIDEEFVVSLYGEEFLKGDNYVRKTQ